MARLSSEDGPVEPTVGIVHGRLNRFSRNSNHASLPRCCRAHATLHTNNYNNNPNTYHCGLRISSKTAFYQANLLIY
eukprot:scaffold4506_cov119-Skeletonema_menzelii.AAC.4